MLIGRSVSLAHRTQARDMAALESFEKRVSTQRSQRPSHRSASPLPDLGPRTGTGLLVNSASGEFPSDVRPSMDTIGALGAHGTHRRVYEGEESINLTRNGLMGRDGEDPFDDRRSIATDQLSFGSTNVIPIAYVPPGQGQGGEGDKMTAGEKLDAARRALGPGFNAVGPPSRPARSPDLDLRLRPAMPGHQPPTSFAHPELVETLGPHGGGNRDLNVNSSRASVLTTRTGVSAAPSFMSGSSAFESEAPQIVTRRQVQTGVVQQAAVVDLSGNNTASLGRNLTAGDARYGWSSGDANGGDRSPGALSARSAMSGTSDPFDDKRADRASGNTFGKMLDSADGHERGEDDTRGDHGTYGLGSGGPTDDLRFSMGSLAMGGGDHHPSRDSMNSSMTGWSVGQVQVGQAQRINLATTPQVPFHPQLRQPQYQRESVASGRSEASSFLNAIIPPSGPMGTPYEKMPTGMSNMTLGQHEQASPSKRDTNANSRQTMMSTQSEGLGGFDFQFDGDNNNNNNGQRDSGPPRQRPA